MNKGAKIDAIPAANEELENLIKSQKLNSYKKIIVLDLDAPYLKKEFEKAGGLFLIIDHHELRKDLNSGKIVYINPRFENKEIYQPTSYIVYKFLSSALSPSIDLNDLEWLAVLGAVGDFAFEDCVDLLGKWVRVNNKKDLIKTDFWKVARMVYGATIVEAEGVIKLLIESNGISNLKSNSKIISAYNKFLKEYENRKKEFWSNAEKINNTIISKIESPLKRVGSIISTDVSIENEDKIIILLERRGNFFKIHSRCQSGETHMGRLMEKCAFLGGGGHRHSAGGSIKISDFEKFKKCIISTIT